MIGLIQRVSHASVIVGDQSCREIGRGLLLFLGIQKTDTFLKSEKMLSKVLNYRVFSDNKGHMNLSLKDINGSLMIVSQFTLAADTKKGSRPSFSAAASPELAEKLYDGFVEAAKALVPVETGQFGVDMEVSLINEGPVTFQLEI